jgi:hypothetical protein
VTARSTLFSIVRSWCEQHPDYPETAEAIVGGFATEVLGDASRREFALQQHVQLLRVALAARGGDNLLTGLDMGPVETGPVQSILLNHSTVTHHAEMTLTQPGGVIQTVEMSNVQFAEVKVSTVAPESSWPSERQMYLTASKRTLTITLEL